MPSISIDHGRDRKLQRKAAALSERPAFTQGEPADVGPDPIKWIGRLQDVNIGSGFTQRQRFIIDDALRNLIQKLQEPYV